MIDKRNSVNSVFSKLKLPAEFPQSPWLWVNRILKSVSDWWQNVLNLPNPDPHGQSERNRHLELAIKEYKQLSEQQRSHMVSILTSPPESLPAKVGSTPPPKTPTVPPTESVRFSRVPGNLSDLEWAEVQAERQMSKKKPTPSSAFSKSKVRNPGGAAKRAGRDKS